MNILILGGSVFLGIQLVNSALRNNHTVTLFNRGKRNPDIFPDAEKLIGDRSARLMRLKADLSMLSLIHPVIFQERCATLLNC